MAHYAFLDENNVVTNVVVGKDECNFDWEQYYSMKQGQVCKRTSYNTCGGVYRDSKTNEPAEDQSKAFRKNFAGVGYTYDPNLDAFIPPKPFNSWILDENTCFWQPPVPYPTDGKEYAWNEESQKWDVVFSKTNSQA